MIVAENPCGPDALKTRYDYLMGTPVKDSVIDMFNQWDVSAHNAQITSLDELGEHYLIWDDLGGYVKHPKYKVREAYLGLHNTRLSPLLGVDNWKTVNEYIDLIEKGVLDLKITVTHTPTTHGNIDIIIDGCKRTTAFFEYHRSLGIKEIDFNFMVLRYKPRKYPLYLSNFIFSHHHIARLHCTRV